MLIAVPAISLLTSLCFHEFVLSITTTSTLPISLDVSSPPPNVVVHIQSPGLPLNLHLHYVTIALSFLPIAAPHPLCFTLLCAVPRSHTVSFASESNRTIVFRLLNTMYYIPTRQWPRLTPICERCCVLEYLHSNHQVHHDEPT